MNEDIEAYCPILKMSVGVEKRRELLEVYNYIKEQEYTFSVKDVLIEYKKMKEGYYISRSFKIVIGAFPSVFKTKPQQ